MKKNGIAFCFLFLSLIGCKEQKKEQKAETSVVESKDSAVENDSLDNLIGKYEYKNTDTPDESLLLIFKKVDIKTIPNFEGYSWQEKNEKGENVDLTLSGIFYGNTDLFDEAREGYKPGFFVATVQSEPSENNVLKVNINLAFSDILENPIYPPIQSTHEALKSGNKKWEVTELEISKELIFEIENSTELILKSDLGSDDKIFKKIK
ncbi:MAG: hypothetical protein REI96_06885 [Flavobacterium nitrogenifigens]|uniref:hypothetical protein n=1 Tax=Flavobacterium nitrogenifigens TaxID=1617283 RepID=UPI0028091D09|nr:hypothetical protein [Flavobacterium nitrogenifigens]MDQ8012153.1 hypothetical protein [Flavobacterium nitrogenifigens]